MNKCLFLCSVNPVARDTGKKVVVHGICSYLLHIYGREKFLVACVDDRVESADWKVIGLSSPSTSYKVLYSIGAFIFGRFSLQEAIFRSPSLGNEIKNLILDFKPDIVIYDTVRLGQYMSKTEGHAKILYLEDLFSVRYQRMLSAMKSKVFEIGDPLGNFGRNLPRAAQFVVNQSKYIQRLLLDRESKLVARSEIVQASESDTALLISGEEVITLQSRAPAANVLEIPPKVTITSVQLRAWHGRPEFVFLGALNLPHNLSGIEAFLDIAMPHLLEISPDVVVRIIGRHAPKSLKDKASQYGDSVCIEGYVADLAPILGQCCAMIVPLMFGSGVKLKVIEALTYGVPIVTTPIGVEGIPFISGIHGVVVNDLSEFPEVLASLKSASLNSQLSVGSKALFDEHYSSFAVDLCYQALFKA